MNLANPPSWMLERIVASSSPSGTPRREPALPVPSPIVDLVTAVGLRPIKKGAELAVCCPRHDDQDPSLRINPELGVWFCDPCGKGGRIPQLRAWLGHPDVQEIRPASQDEEVAQWLRQEIALPASEIERIFAVATPWGAACVFLYVSRDGVVVRRKCMLIDSGERWFDNSDVRPLLYGIEQLVGAPTAPVTIVATELDAHVLRAVGVRPVVALPFGLRTEFTPGLLAPIAQSIEVRLALGGGENADRVAEKLANLVGRDRSKRLRFTTKVLP